MAIEQRPEIRDVHTPEESFKDGTSVYLREIGRVKLLTAEQEIELAKGIELGRFASEQLTRPDHSSEDRENLDRIVQEGLEAKRKLIEANLRLVVSVARKHIGGGFL